MSTGWSWLRPRVADAGEAGLDSEAACQVPCPQHPDLLRRSSFFHHSGEVEEVEEEEEASSNFLF